MLKIKKLSAFTLAEMIVVLILTTIVVGIAFTILNLVQKQMLGAQENYSMHSELNLLKQSLWIDMNRYSRAHYSNQNQTLNFSSEVDFVQYNFHENYIIKDLDTFNIKTDSKTFFYKGQSVFNGVLDAIKLYTQKDKPSLLFIYKQNDAKAYMD